MKLEDKISENKRGGKRGAKDTLTCVNVLYKYAYFDYSLPMSIFEINCLLAPIILIIIFSRILKYETYEVF